MSGIEKPAVERKIYTRVTITGEDYDEVIARADEEFAKAAGHATIRHTFVIVYGPTE